MHRNRDGSSGRISLSFLYVQRIAENWVWLSAFFFYKDHCCFTVIAFVFIFSTGARMAKKGLVTGPKKGGRQFVIYLFLLFFFAYL